MWGRTLAGAAGESTPPREPWLRGSPRSAALEGSCRGLPAGVHQPWDLLRDRCGHVPLLDSGHPQAAGTSPSAARAPRPGRGAVPASLLFLAALCFCCGDVLRLLVREGQDQKVLKRPFQHPACERPSACCLRRAGTALPWGRTV